VSAEGSAADASSEGESPEAPSAAAFGDPLDLASLHGNARNGDPFAASATTKPEIAVAAAFAGGFLLAVMLRRRRMR
jgi:hypothetical protein